MACPNLSKSGSGFRLITFATAGISLVFSATFPVEVFPSADSIFGVLVACGPTPGENITF